MRSATTTKQLATIGVSMLLVTVSGCGGSGTSKGSPPPPPGRALSGGIANAIAPTSDGGFVVAGTTNPDASGGTNVRLMKLDAAANLEWDVAYSGTGNTNESGWSVRPTGHGFLVAGRTDDAALGNGLGGIYVLETGDNGALMWQRTFGGVADPRTLNAKVAARQTSDGGYVVAGTVPGTDHDEPDAYIAKLTPPDDFVEWAQTFGTGGNQWWEAYDAVEIGGEFVLVGTREESLASVPFAIRVSAPGGTSTGWDASYGTSAGAIYSVERSSTDGDLILIGERARAPDPGCGALILKVNPATGAPTLERTVGDLLSCGWVAGRQTSDGGFVLVGRGKANNGDAYVIRTDASGNELWSRLYGGNGNDVARAVLERPDGDLVVVGSTTSFGGTPSVYLLRLDGSGTPR